MISELRALFPYSDRPTVVLIRKISPDNEKNTKTTACEVPTEEILTWDLLRKKGREEMERRVDLRLAEHAAELLKTSAKISKPSNRPNLLNPVYTTIYRFITSRHGLNWFYQSCLPKLRDNGPLVG